MKNTFILLLALLLTTLSAVSGAEPTRVMITVDVESYHNGNPEQQIWGRQPDGDHGITRIMDMLDAHGLKGTFYLNVYEAATHGDAELAKIARTIHERGHDLELHTHPISMYGIFSMRRADYAKQVEILKHGQEMIEKWTGKHVIAHRAGAFDGNLDTLKAAHDVGLLVDSSISPASRQTEFARTLPASNLPRGMEGVVELPITFYTQAGFGKWRSLHFLDVESCTYDEMVSVIRQFRDQGFPAVTIMMHSFSFVRYGKARPMIEKRFDRLLQFLATEPGIKPVTVTQFYTDWAAKPAPASKASDLVPYTGLWLTYWRSVEHAQEGGLNLLLAVSPLVAVLVLGALVLVLRRRRKLKKAAYP